VTVAARPTVVAQAPAASARIDPALVARVGVGAAVRDVDALTALGARLRRGELSAEVVAAMQTADELAAGPGHVTIGLTAFTTAVCAHMRSFAACATATGGWWTGRGEALFDASTVRLPYIAAGMRVGWAYPMSARFSVELAAGVEVGLTTSRFLVDQMPIWTSPRLSANGTVAAIVQIP
jgi:hypothetical protein